MPARPAMAAAASVARPSIAAGGTGSTPSRAVSGPWWPRTARNRAAPVPEPTTPPRTWAHAARLRGPPPDEPTYHRFSSQKSGRSGHDHGQDPCYEGPAGGATTADGKRVVSWDGF